MPGDPWPMCPSRLDFAFNCELRGLQLALLGPLLLLSACGGHPDSSSAAGVAIPTPSHVGAVSIAPTIAALGPDQPLAFSAAGAGVLDWSVNDAPGGNETVGTIDSAGHYVAPAITRSTNVVIRAALPGSTQSNYATAVVALIAPGNVTQTSSPQVAQYQIDLPQPGKVTVQFGADAKYGLKTWALAPGGTQGGPVTLQVAGMRGNSRYHLQGLIELANGATLKDADLTFETGTPIPTPPLVVTNPNNLQPQPGVELFDAVLFGSSHYDPTLAQAFVTDLQGNVLWSYRYQGNPANVITPVKLLPNGHFLLNITVTTPANGPPVPSGTLNELREIDLAGNIVRRISVDTFNQSLVAAGHGDISLFAFSHDLLALPNGHYVLLASYAKPVTGVLGYNGSTNVAGDAIIDVDADFKPTWVWSTFDHLDVNRHPFEFPDWTHSDALLYSPDDHALLLSIRNQNWIVKLDFRDGTGPGDIFWRLGQGGDFRLVGGTEPTDWFYAQHGFNFFSSNSSGAFRLGVFDDGDDRQYPAGSACANSNQPPCLYSTAEVFSIDESAMTATLTKQYIPKSNQYSFFGGNVTGLANGDTEVNFASPVPGALIQEIQPGTTVRESAPTVVWQATTPGVDMYRAQRLPSLYPGIEW